MDMAQMNSSTMFLFLVIAWTVPFPLFAIRAIQVAFRQTPPLFPSVMVFFSLGLCFATAGLCANCCNLVPFIRCLRPITKHNDLDILVASALNSGAKDSKLIGDSL